MPRVTNVIFTPASDTDRRSGLLGWVSFTLGDLVLIDGVAVRQTRGGRTVLTFPARRDRWGHRHFFVQPRDNRMRRDITRQVLSRLELSQ